MEINLSNLNVYTVAKNVTDIEQIVKQEREGDPFLIVCLP